MKDTFREVCVDCGEPADWNDNVEELAARVAAPCDDACDDDACDDAASVEWNGAAYRSPAPADCGRWETNEDCNGYNWIPEYHAPAANANAWSQCYCSGNDSMCDECHGTGAVRCG